jgi:hypothetical protein
MGVKADGRHFVNCRKRTLSLVAAILEVVENVLVPDAIVVNAVHSNAEDSPNRSTEEHRPLEVLTF